MFIKKGSRIGITVCSNGQQEANRDKLNLLLNTIKDIGYEPVCTDYIFEETSYFSGTGSERAEALLSFYKNPDIRAIFDISGGDIANEILDYIDFKVIKEHPKFFYGYSDNTTIINAIYKKTGRPSGLYQIRNLIYEDSENQIKNFTDTFVMGNDSLTNISYYFIQDSFMEGIVVGGNIRCFLKLAGTEYLPDLEGKILFLEALNSTSAQVMTYLCQLKQMKAFEKVNGILLGTFTRLDSEIFVPSVEELVQKVAGKDVPIARTMDIGHGANAKCIYVGEHLSLQAC